MHLMKPKRRRIKRPTQTDPVRLFRGHLQALALALEVAAEAGFSLTHTRAGLRAAHQTLLDHYDLNIRSAIEVATRFYVAEALLALGGEEVVDV
jgi:hypothetical protein